MRAPATRDGSARLPLPAKNPTSERTSGGPHLHFKHSTRHRQVSTSDSSATHFRLSLALGAAAQREKRAHGGRPVFGGATLNELARERRDLIKFVALP